MSGHFSWKKFARPGISQDELVEMKEAFDLFDVAGCGVVDIREVQTALQGLGIDTNNSTLHAMLSELSAMDGDTGTRGMNFEQFIDVMAARSAERDSKDDIQKVFRLLDEEHKGYLTVGNLEKVCKQLGEQYSVEDLKEMVERAAGGGSKVVFDDFYTVLARRVFP
mmetsp:Transcript_72816/g.167150  ORF Transcript_72816/g.167150 Transcript_72816/m.167150 type:complete len:166 (-) Transcript_72816:46-543(-)